MLRALLGLSCLMGGAYLLVEGLGARAAEPAPTFPRPAAPGWAEV